MPPTTPVEHREVLPVVRARVAVAGSFGETPSLPRSIPSRRCRRCSALDQVGGSGDDRDAVAAVARGSRLPWPGAVPPIVVLRVVDLDAVERVAEEDQRCAEADGVARDHACRSHLRRARSVLDVPADDIAATGPLVAADDRPHRAVDRMPS